jgi:hypothetical protein
MNDKDVELYKKLQDSILYFIYKMWGLVPQPVKSDYKQIVSEYIENGEFDKIQAGWFEPFEKGKHITWQQWLFCLAIKKAMRGLAPKRISIRSGHGTGKSAGLSWVILWFLFCFKNAQMSCTAPTSQQMHDILWKEVSLWLNKMPDRIKDLYEWSNGYVRIKENPEAWFARAVTARRENPEALAGTHGEFVALLLDEASGVPQEVVNTAEGSLTNKNILVVMISNPTRLIGYFYDSHHSDKENWQTLRFNSEESPIVDREYVERIAKKHGADSDEYKIRVLGMFPKADAVDEWGYVPILTEKDLNEVPDCDFIGRKKMGIDPSGEGKNETKWIVRDEFKAKIVATEKISTEKSIAQKTLSLMEFYDLKGVDVIVDNFGAGANVAKELALSGVDINAVNVGDSSDLPDDKELYENKRAEMFSKLKKWLRSGGELIRDEDWKQLLLIRMKRTLKGSKIQIMPKQEMKKKMGIGNLDAADALALTFLIPDKSKFKQFKDDFKPRSKYQGK